jgi:hypothetical protein
MLLKPGTLSKRLWWLLLCVPVVELMAHAWVRLRVPSAGEWHAAAAFVRQNLRPGDVVVGAPAWADPVLRWVIGDAIALRDAGRSDVAGYQRVWALGIRGSRPPELADRPPTFEKRFGSIRTTRWDLGTSTVLFDFTSNVRRAHVTLVDKGVERQCPWVQTAPLTAGGLFGGVMVPPQRFACDPARPWLWVAPTVMEDLDLKLRHCLWSHPLGIEPLRVRFDKVPVGKSIVVYGGLDYNVERMMEGGPVTLTVMVDGRPVGRLVHNDGDGWKKQVIPIGAAPAARDVAFEITAPDPNMRLFCWSATSRRDGGTHR